VNVVCVFVFVVWVRVCAAGRAGSGCKERLTRAGFPSSSPSSSVLLSSALRLGGWVVLVWVCVCVSWLVARFSELALSRAPPTAYGFKN
jgi:hypothetical protein